MPKSRSLKKQTKQAKAISFRTQEQAMEYLRLEHPEFFEDEGIKQLAFVIVSELSLELSKFPPVERATLIATVMTLMYKMSSATTKYIRSDGDSSMVKILFDNYIAERQSNT